MRSEDTFDYLLGPLGNKNVELFRTNPDLIADFGPIQLVGLPTLRHDAARVTHQRRESPQVQQLGPVRVRQRWLGCSPRVRNSRWAHLIGGDGSEMSDLPADGFRIGSLQQQGNVVEFRG